jgi:predicted O-methyltransferase YrrM
MWSQPSKTRDIRPIPWLSPVVVAELEKRLTKDMTIIEFGGGGSTLWLAERVKRVITYENSLDWYQVINKQASPNVDINNLSVWNEEDTCDVLIIDGEPVELRGLWLKDAPLICNGGLVVLDNSNRPEYAKERSDLAEIAKLEYRSPLIAQHLITEFWRLPRLDLE